MIPSVICLSRLFLYKVETKKFLGFASEFPSHLFVEPVFIKGGSIVILGFSRDFF